MENENLQHIMEKEIDLIQSCINRMSQNSFNVKGWTVSLLAVIFALLPEKFNVYFLGIAGFLIVGSFWYLDAFFLRIEKLYRQKYEWVIHKRLSTTDFCYDLNPNNEKMHLGPSGSLPQYPSQWDIMCTPTLLHFYGTILLLVIAFFLVA